MELIRFIFSDIWIWLGCFLMLAFTLSSIVSIIKAVKPNRKISVFPDKDGEQVAIIENATLEDIRWVTQRVKNIKALIDEQKGDKNNGDEKQWMR